MYNSLLYLSHVCTVSLRAFFLLFSLALLFMLLDAYSTHTQTQVKYDSRNRNINYFKEVCSGFRLLPKKGASFRRKSYGTHRMIKYSVLVSIHFAQHKNTRHSVFHLAANKLTKPTDRPTHRPNDPQCQWTQARTKIKLNFFLPMCAHACAMQWKWIFFFK